MPRRTRQLSNHWLEICRGSLLASVVIPQSLAYGGSSFAADAGPEKLAQVVREIDLSWIAEDRANHGGGECSGGGDAGLAREGYAPIITIADFPEGHEVIAGPKPSLRKLDNCYKSIAQILPSMC